MHPDNDFTYGYFRFRFSRTGFSEYYSRLGLVSQGPPDESFWGIAEAGFLRTDRMSFRSPNQYCPTDIVLNQKTKPHLFLVLLLTDFNNLLPARRSKRGLCYSDVAGWVAGCHAPVLYQNG